jgi:hypothetical protein
MTHPCCQSCRLRLAPSAEDRPPCPVCGGATVALDARGALGYQRYVAELSESLAAAVASARHDHAGAGPPR